MGIMTFRPTMRQFEDFNSFIQYIESKGAHKYGIAKVIPPVEWKPRHMGYNDDDVLNKQIMEPIKQYVKGTNGTLIQKRNELNRISVRDFKALAESPKYRPPQYDNIEDLEKEFWKMKMHESSIYGADVADTLMDDDLKVWNLNKLDTLLKYLHFEDDITIEGINTPYLYFGMWKSAFPWHTEDMDLYSINYIHEGHPKTWYAIPPEYGRKFENLCKELFPDISASCPGFLRHKYVLTSPRMLEDNSIPCNKITHERGEFIITFPYGYHAGFNHGFNIAEAVNFASPRWVEYGKRATHCKCKQKPPTFSMVPFMRRIQGSRFEAWVQGKDFGYHPEDPTHRFAATPPKKKELRLQKPQNDFFL